MNRVPLLLQQNSNLNVLNLENSDIDTLDQLLPWLIEFTELEELNLSSNKLNSLPSDLSKLRKLKKLDLSKNLFSSTKSYIPGLKTLPSLVDLKLEGPEDIIISCVPNVLRLNNKDIGDRGKSWEIDLSCIFKYPEEDLKLKQEELEEIALMYDEIRSLWREEDGKIDEKLAEFFDTGIKKIMTGLTETHSKGFSDHILYCYNLKGKYMFYNICQDKAIEYINKTNPKLAGIMQNIHKAYYSIFEQTASVVFSIDKKYLEILGTFKSQLDESNARTAKLLEAAEKLEKDFEKNLSEKTSLKGWFEQDRQDLMERIKDLSDENKRYLDIIVKNSKSSAESAMNLKKYSVQQQAKNLNLRQLKEIIQEIYDSKILYDKKRLKESLPRETVEKHMYTYLNNKYGLKTLVIEWAAGIITGIKKFADQDNDILVFGKILKNEIDEEFRFIQKKLKETIVNLLKSIVAKKKNIISIDDKVQQKVRGWVKKQEIREIVSFLYNEKDAKEVSGIIANALDSKGRMKYHEFQQVVLGFQQKLREKILSKLIGSFKLIDSDQDGIISSAQFLELLSLLEIKQKDLSLLETPAELTISDCVMMLSKDLIFD